MNKALTSALVVVLCNPLLGNAHSPEVRNAIWRLRGCAVRPATRGCSEDTAIVLIRAYKSGDRTILRALADASRHSDGALSEAIGPFLAEVLLSEPDRFLAELARRPMWEQRLLAQQAASTDGSCLSDDEWRKARRILNSRKHSRQRTTARVAALCLSELNVVNARCRRAAA